MNVEFVERPPFADGDVHRPKWPYRRNSFWPAVLAVLDTKPGTWALVVRNTGSPQDSKMINRGIHPQVDQALYEAHHTSRRVDGRTRYDLYLRRRPAVSSTPTA